MPRLSSKFYQINEPIRILKKDGYSLSNTYVGSSRAANAVQLAMNAEPGDEIHDLPGGMFHVSASSGETRNIKLVPQKHIFEKSYGPDPDVTRLEALEKASLITELDHSNLTANYKQARKFSDQKHPDLTGGIRNVDRDPLEDISDEMITCLEDAGIDFDAESIRFRSQTAYEPAHTTFSIIGSEGIWKAFIYDKKSIRLMVPIDSPGSNIRFSDADPSEASWAQIGDSLADFIRQIVPAAPAP